jgi:hypothetical protein
MERSGTRSQAQSMSGSKTVPVALDATKNRDICGLHYVTRHAQRIDDIFRSWSEIASRRGWLGIGQPNVGQTNCGQLRVQCLRMPFLNHLLRSTRLTTWVCGRVHGIW